MGHSFEGLTILVIHSGVVNFLDRLPPHSLQTTARACLLSLFSRTWGKSEGQGDPQSHWKEFQNVSYLLDPIGHINRTARDLVWSLE